MATHSMDTSTLPVDAGELGALTELIRRIGKASDSMHLSGSDKLRITYGLRLLRLEITQHTDTVPNKVTP
ncbi:hypothetical protein [Spirosoma fluminis]